MCEQDPVTTLLASRHSVVRILVIVGTHRQTLFFNAGQLPMTY